MSAAKKTATKAAKKTAAKTTTKTTTKKTAQKVAVEKSAKKAGVPEKDWWELRLYVAGQTPRSIEAFANLERICEEHLHGRYRIEVIDLLLNPTLARGDQILAVPTLVRQLPPPMKKIIGDFSNRERVLVGLNLLPINPPDRSPARPRASKQPARS